MKLHWNSLGELAKEFLSRARERVYILVPFISTEALNRIVPPEMPITVVTSWQPEHLRTGISSLTIYEMIQSREESALYIHRRLHMKVYGNDLTRSGAALLIGSANLTGRGMGLFTAGNREVLAEINKISLRDRAEIQRCIAEATYVDQALYERYRIWLQTVGIQPRDDKFEEGPPDPYDLSERPKFLVTDLPLSDSPYRLWEFVSSKEEPGTWWEEDAAIHDLAHYGGSSLHDRERFIEETKQRFFTHEFIEEFLGEVDEGGVYFGRAKEWIQQVCHDVPTPRRRDLTLTVQALFRWVSDLAPDKFEVVQPRHSECLRRRT